VSITLKDIEVIMTGLFKEQVNRDFVVLVREESAKHFDRQMRLLMIEPKLNVLLLSGKITKKEFEQFWTMLNSLDNESFDLAEKLILIKEQDGNTIHST
jgi:hypothetical protein